jgi:hypothetical protein
MLSLVEIAGRRGPADALAHVVRYLLGASRPHVAGHTGRRGGVIDPDSPVVSFEVESVFVGLPKDAVLRLLVDFDLRVVGTEMAFSAGFGFARLRLREAMPAASCRRD